MTSSVRTLIGRFLITVLFLNCFGSLSLAQTPVQQRDRIIVVNADQPNVWTLEQAHYLLAQMHRRNLDLKAKSLEDLDPNEIAGLRFDVMRMLVEFGATFNQADLASNRLFSRNQAFNTERRENLLAERSGLRRESLRLTGEIEELETQKADTKDEDEIKRLDAKIAAKTNRLARVDKEIELINDELETLNAPSGELKATEAGAEFDPDRLPKSVFDKAFEEAAKTQIEKFNQAPRLNASLRLENFLQMQYEIIAKQLTLLRDEVGPGERLLFLELPQTVNVAHHQSNNKWAQSWWKIVGYTKRMQSGTPELAVASESSAQPVDENQEPITVEDDLNSILDSKRKIDVRLKPSPTPPATLAPTGTSTPSSSPSRTQMQVKYVNQFFELKDEVEVADEGSQLKDYLEREKSALSNRMVRTVELIPRQSSLNVNDMKLSVRSGAFNLVLSTLFGFGSQLNVQRQREQFSQFVQQELYSAAFGKGSREFGWTFTPMPGMERLMSGVRTTYAVVVVPESVTSLVLEANGCYFPRSHYQPNNFLDTKSKRWNVDERRSRNCGGETTKAFLVPIPSASMNGNNDFWVKSISYKPVGKGKRIVVLISGDNFSSQIGVLVNGVPLVHSIGLAQPLIRDDSRAGEKTLEEFKDAKVKGRIERVDSNKIVFSFEILDGFEGKPNITLVAPGKAIDLNWLDNIEINGREPARLNASSNACKNEADDAARECERICGTGDINTNCLTVAEELFRGDPLRPLRIDNIEVFRLRGRRTVTVLVTGAGFKNSTEHKLYVNGVLIPKAYVSETLLHAENIDAPSDDRIQVTLSAGAETIKSSTVANPASLKIDRVTVVSYEPASGRRAGVLVVRIEGSGFPNLLNPSPRKIRVNVTSSTEAFLTIPNPDETEVVTLTDPVTELSVSTVIARKPPPK